MSSFSDIFSTTKSDMKPNSNPTHCKGVFIASFDESCKENLVKSEFGSSFAIKSLKLLESCKWRELLALGCHIRICRKAYLEYEIGRV